MDLRFREIQVQLGTIMVAVSIVVPIYNVAEYLPQCLDSILAQTCGDFEVLAVDDGSTDESGRILDEYAAKDPRIKAIHQANAGAAAARNVGLDSASGEWLFFCDPDDWVGPELVATVASGRWADCQVVLFDHLRENCVDGTTMRLKVSSYFSRHDRFDPKDYPDHLIQGVRSVPWNKLFRRDFILERGIQFQSLPRNNDVFFVYSAVCSAPRIGVVRRFLYHHRQFRPGSLQMGFDRHPFCFYESRDAVAAFLRQRDLFAPFRHTLTKSMLDEALAMGCRYESLENFVEGYRRLRDRLLNDSECAEVIECRLLAKSKVKILRKIRETDDPIVFLMRHFQRTCFSARLDSSYLLKVLVSRVLSRFRGL